SRPHTSPPFVPTILLTSSISAAEFFSSPSTPPRAPPSFPTRRSSDLAIGRHPGDEPTSSTRAGVRDAGHRPRDSRRSSGDGGNQDRKSTRLNSSHGRISYAVFCLKKKKTWTRHCDTRPGLVSDTWRHL